LENKTAPIIKETKEIIFQRQIPKKYYNLLQAFFKKESDQLSPNQIYNYKIKLKKDIFLSYHFLYYITIEKLQILKKYFRDNLNKGFIEYNSVLFASPILFIKKPKDKLQFCIHYCKLNELTKKN